MKEDFLHYLWKFKKFDFLHVQTVQGEPVELLHTGTHNQDKAGPDFFNAKLRIGTQLWAGNVEIHLRSSDWYAHHHETDARYDNVILHVVWEDDVAVFRKNNEPIPTLTLCDKVAQNALKNYDRLLEKKDVRWINCAPDFPHFSDFAISSWLERLFIERLEEKSTRIQAVLNQTTQDWEATLFCMLARNFGLNVNGEAFMQMALSIPLSVVRKMETKEEAEALFFGQVGLLEKPIEEPYYRKLQTTYAYLKRKYKLTRKNTLSVHYFRLRPSNFPTIRLAQLAALFIKEKNLFSKVIVENNLDKIKTLFNVQITTFWNTHYSFEKVSKKRKKNISSAFINLLLINTLIPLKFCYAKAQGKEINEQLLAMMHALPAEKNSITEGYNQLRPKTITNALTAQAALRLKKEYCDKNRCLNCNLGLKILQKK